MNNIWILSNIQTSLLDPNCTGVLAPWPCVPRLRFSKIWTFQKRRPHIQMIIHIGCGDEFFLLSSDIFRSRIKGLVVCLWLEIVTFYIQNFGSLSPEPMDNLIYHFLWRFNNFNYFEPSRLMALAKYWDKPIVDMGLKIY